MAPSLVNYPSPVETITFTLLGGILPALIWLWFWLKEDRAHPEPKWLIRRVFLAGAASVVLAYFVERDIYRLFMRELGQTGEPGFAILLIWAAVEELIKFGVAYLIVFKNKAFDEPIDAMIYLITAALGFAALENAFFLFETLRPTFETNTFLLTGNLRFLGATLLHVVTSATMGGIIALAFCARHRPWRGLYIILGFLAATLLHLAFNWFIINSQGENILQIFSLLWVSTIFIIWLFEKVKTVVCK